MMKLKVTVTIALVAAGFWCQAVGDKGNDAPDFKEVYELLRTNLTGVNNADLNRAAVQGLLKELAPQARLVTNSSAPSGPTNAPALAVASIFENQFGYLRVRQVGSGLDKDLWAAYQGLAMTNKLKGLVLDLRFAGGQDYAAAATTADWFFNAEQPLIDWGEGTKRSTAKSNAVSVPLALLVNQKTTGAAEALAGILRFADVGLLIGATTSGQASMAKEFGLQNGQRLRIAVAPVQVGSGQTLPHTGLKPDIQVEVSPDDELAWFDDAYKVLSKPRRGAVAGTTATNEVNLTSTNRASRRRINEAGLVRMLKEGQDIESNTTPRDTDPAPPVINDPALARAIDLLKGLTVVQQFRSI
jgi:hypothetical protein